MLKKKNQAKVFSKVGSDIVAQIVGDGVSSVPVILNITLSAGTWTEWEIPVGMTNFTMKARSSEAITMATSSAGTPYFTIPAGASFNMDSMFGAQESSLWLRSVGGNVMEIIYWS